MAVDVQVVKFSADFDTDDPRYGYLPACADKVHKDHKDLVLIRCHTGTRESPEEGGRKAAAAARNSGRLMSIMI